MLPPPGSLVPDPAQTSGEAIGLRWSPLEELSAAKPRVRVEARPVAGDEAAWEALHALPVAQRQAFTLPGRQPETSYYVRYVADYDQQLRLGNAPPTTKVFSYKSSPLTVTTREAGPPSPRNVAVSPTGATWNVTWEPPLAGPPGLSLAEYEVEYKFASSDPAWTNAGEKPKALWWSPGLRLGTELSESSIFRVRAVYSKGGQRLRSGFASSKNPGIDASEGFIGGVIAAVVVMAVVLIVCLVGVMIFYRRRRRSKAAKEGRGGGFTSAYFDSTASTVTTVLDRTSDQAGSIQALKAISPEELQALPHVGRGNITIARMLGKGAFGEVYEGLACNLPKAGPKSRRIAIKTLRHNSREEERVKFLKEAVMMSGFEHENIVRLLGVCLDSEPHWIILELMEGGDLLSFLRAARPTEGMPSQVSLRELVGMMVDVVGGCAYLEDQHHVHRDLAARNCLLTAKDSQNRRVKIADFGLTRDVYTEDYYRVEGQGLLPIRWMAPESMVDGVFTHKTDVWSVGVVLWEIMTLGQQPYPGRSNWDVLNYVRIGGLLECPAECPSSVFDVCLACWTFKAELRPTMREAEAQLKRLAEGGALGGDEPFPSCVAALGGALLTESSFSASASTALPSASHQGSAEAPGPKAPADGVFVTGASGHGPFDRDSKSAQSLRPEEKRKVFGFRSFRKSTKPRHPPAKPPSRLDVNFNADGTLSPSDSEAYGELPHRPTSGVSSGAESFTTQRTDYEVPLFKGATNRQRQARGEGGGEASTSLELTGSANPAYVSSPEWPPPDSPYSSSLSTFRKDSSPTEDAPYAAAGPRRTLPRGESFKRERRRGSEGLAVPCPTPPSSHQPPSNRSSAVESGDSEPGASNTLTRAKAFQTEV